VKNRQTNSPNPSRAESLRAPVTREEVMADLRRMIIASADHLALVGPRNACVDEFLGFSVGEWELGKIPAIDPDRIDLSRYNLTDLVNRAYDFAWQVGPRKNQIELDEISYLSMLTFLQGSHPTFLSDSTDALLGDNSPLWQTLEAGRARQGLVWGRNLDIKQLALLARMTEAATRASLSKEGIRTTGEKSADRGLSLVSIDEALRWLKGRRGYTPTERPEPTDPIYLDGDIRPLLNNHGWTPVVNEITEFSGFQTLADLAEVEAEWLMEVITGGEAEIDIAGLERVGEVVSQDAPRFVSFATERLLRAKAERQNAVSQSLDSTDQVSKGR